MINKNVKLYFTINIALILIEIALMATFLRFLFHEFEHKISTEFLIGTFAVFATISSILLLVTALITMQCWKKYRNLNKMAVFMNLCLTFLLIFILNLYVYENFLSVIGHVEFLLTPFVTLVLVLIFISQFLIFHNSDTFAQRHRLKVTNEQIVLNNKQNNSVE